MSVIVEVKLVLNKEIIVMFFLCFMFFLCMGLVYKVVLCFYGKVYFICVKIVDMIGKSFGDDFSLRDVCDGGVVLSWVDGDYELFF